MTSKQNKARMRQLTDSLISPAVEIRLWEVVLSADILAAGFSLMLCGSHIIDTEKIQFAGYQSIKYLKFIHVRYYHNHPLHFEATSSQSEVA